MMKDGVYGHVTGTVERVGHAQSGLYAVLAIQDEKKQYPDRVTVWGINGTMVSESDRLKVKGWLSWRKEDKGDKTYFNVSLNKPEILEHERLTGNTAPATAQDFEAETPF